MKVYRVRLAPRERAHLEELLSKGKAAARTLTHARILLKADEGEAGPRLRDEAIAEALEANRSTVNRSASGVSRKGSRRRCIRVLRARCMRARSTPATRPPWRRGQCALPRAAGGE